jgi:hypothetical protein
MSNKDTIQIISEQLGKINFPHFAPEGYSYEIRDYKRNVIAIWIRDHRKYVYNGGDPVYCIWGFFNSKTKSYHSPINSSKIGSIVDIKNTTPYSAMPISQTPLTAAFV